MVKVCLVGWLNALIEARTNYLFENKIKRFELYSIFIKDGSRPYNIALRPKGTLRGFMMCKTGDHEGERRWPAPVVYT